MSQIRTQKPNIFQRIAVFNSSLQRFLLLSAFCSVTACTGITSKKPELGAYTHHGNLLIEASQKLSLEEDVPRLHNVALSMDAARTLACDDYNGECDGFADFLTKTIQSTKSGTITPEDRADLLTRARKIKEAVEEGRKKLKQ